MSVHTKRRVRGVWDGNGEGRTRNNGLFPLPTLPLRLGGGGDDPRTKPLLPICRSENREVTGLVLGGKPALFVRRDWLTTSDASGAAVGLADRQKERAFPLQFG